MKKIPCWQTLLCGALLLVAIQAGAAEIQVAVDRNPVGLNESFQITFSASEEPDGNPDFSPLWQNFEILNQQRSSNSSWVNGQSNRTEQWILNVMARQAGEALIPPIAFGSDSSKPLNITVSDQPNAVQSNEDIFLEVSATPERPYVQSQVLYTLKLFRRVQITQASLNEPEIKDAIVEKLGEDSNYSTQINGVDYWVTERKYAVFPQQSGLFTIAPLTLNAEVVSTQRPRFNGFFNRQITETRRVTSKAITLSVQTVPAEFKGQAWLSAESVQLSEKWSDNALQTKVGEPLTRTLTLSAKGATVGQLPELQGQNAIDGIKAYPDQPQLTEDKQSDGLMAVREEKIAFIPSRPGRFTLPGLEVSWFNIRTQKMEIASLPAVALEAQAGADTATAGSGEISVPQPGVPVSNFGQGDVRFWQTVSAVSAVGWLLTVIGFYLRTPLIRKPKIMPADARKTDADIEKSLKHACWENNPEAAKLSLLQWGRRRFGLDSLRPIAQCCDGPLRNEIERLNQYLYSGQQQAWNGGPLWQAFETATFLPPQQARLDDGLEPLFKL